MANFPTHNTKSAARITAYRANIKSVPLVTTYPAVSAESAPVSAHYSLDCLVAYAHYDYAARHGAYSREVGASHVGIEQLAGH